MGGEEGRRERNKSLKSLIDNKEEKKRFDYSSSTSTIPVAR